MTSLNSLFRAFGGGIAGRLGSGNWTDFFGKLSDFLQQLFSPMPVMHDLGNNETSNPEKVLDIVKKSNGRWYDDEDSVHIKHFKTDTVVKWGRTGYYRHWEHKNIALEDTINYKDFEIIDKIKH